MNGSACLASAICNARGLCALLPFAAYIASIACSSSGSQPMPYTVSVGNMTVAPERTQAATSLTSSDSDRCAARMTRIALRIREDSTRALKKCFRRVTHSGPSLSRRSYGGLYCCLFRAGADLIRTSPPQPCKRPQPAYFPPHATPVRPRPGARQAAHQTCIGVFRASSLGRLTDLKVRLYR